MFSDVLIIGAGPCGLAVAARLRESTPSALFTDEEHARYWKRFNRRDPDQSGRHSDKIHHGAGEDLKITVLDSEADQWLGAWNRRFSQFNISHLRSPLFFHPDPRDKDGLLAYAHHQGRANELIEIEHVTGKEYSKHSQKKHHQRGRKAKVERHLRIDGRDRIDYFTPSTSLFRDYCCSIVDRYGLRHVVHRAHVTGVEYHDNGCPSNGHVFQVETTSGTYMAKILVIATGATSAPCIPPDHNLSISPGDAADSVCHCFDRSAPNMMETISHGLAAGRSPKVVLVGGGLTSAQLADLLIQRGVSHVWLIMRSKYKVKHFDVDLEWVSKVRNQRMAQFWSADSDDERAMILREAKNGGSITPAFDKILQRHVKRGKLTLLPCTRITHGTWDNGWSLVTEPRVEAGLPKIDYVFFATGVKPDFATIPFLRDLQRVHGMEVMGGLPIINDDMMWNDDLPCFFTGALAALRLGPGAANLAGARQGAERIAWKVEQLLGSRDRNGRAAFSGLLQENMSDGEESVSMPESVISDDVSFDSSTNTFEALAFDDG
jgi:lysine/ornithine N-monooxygenase